MKIFLAIALIASSLLVIGCGKEEKVQTSAEKDPGFVMVPSQKDPNYKK